MTGLGQNVWSQIMQYRAPTFPATFRLHPGHASAGIGAVDFGAAVDGAGLLAGGAGGATGCGTGRGGGCGAPEGFA